MRYISVEANEKAAVADFLLDIVTPHPFTEEEVAKWNDDAEKYGGKNYDEFSRDRNRQYMEQMMPLYLQYLPEPLREYARKGLLLKGADLPESVVRRIHETAADLRREMDDMNQAWQEETAAIRDKIPWTVRHYIDGCLHDSKVLAVDRSCNGRLIIELDTSASYIGPKRAQLIFDGVKKVEIPENIVGSWWIDNVYHLYDNGIFQIEALLADENAKWPCNKMKFIVEANELIVEHVWIVRTLSWRKTKSSTVYKRRICHSIGPISYGGC